MPRARALEVTALSERPLFQDVTGTVFDGVASFTEQLSRGTPYWMARIDPASGIDIYGNNGIAVGDIDNDGIDELFVCQPGGLPNRLYKLVHNSTPGSHTVELKISGPGFQAYTLDFG